MVKTTTKSTAKTKTAKNARAKSANSKTTVKAAAKTGRVNLTPESLQKLVLGANVALAVLAGVLMAPVVFPLTLGYLTRDELLSTAETVFVPAQRVQYELELKWVLVALLAFGALYALLLITRWQRGYEKAQGTRIYLWRWVYLAISGATLVSIVAVLTGVYDLLALKLIGGLTALSYGFAWLSERQNERARRPVVSAYLLGLASALLPWIMIGGYTFATTVYGLVRLPWFVYAAQAAVLLGTIGIFLNLWMGHTRRKQWKDYVNVERSYVVVSGLMLAAVAVILIVGIAR